MKKYFAIILSLLMGSFISFGQDTSKYELRLTVPVIDLPQNSTLSYHVPSMNQSLELSNDFYELGFWGIDHLGNGLFQPDTYPDSGWRKLSNNAFKYALGLGFAKYGSELPIPLGVWAHEEFHRSVLGVNEIASKNGNWLFSRWDGTVYGVSDAQLDQLKSTNNQQLLYSYVAGVQYEVALNELTTLNEFYKKRTQHKNALLLYNAHYVFNYFKFSTSAFSDSVKILAPPHEHSDPAERDFAGADLTAWAFDMFNPSLPFTARDSFPNGEGVNRRVGYSDLSSDAQSFLIKQRKLSLLNFLNPAIFFVNRIKVNNHLSFNFFAQYAPTHFGNDVALFLPVQFKNYDLLVKLHNYSNQSNSGWGLGLGLHHFQLNEKIETDLTLNVWNQPETFFANKMLTGGSVQLNTSYYFRENLAAYVSITGKTKGWMLGNSYLDSNLSIQVGIQFNIAG
ncbi:MAG: hypothetical protein JXR22_14110 [Prolixibacteraceae bacterium]|nr:hypothetical protein [Prolixibacteraceae bacterium]